MENYFEIAAAMFGNSYNVREFIKAGYDKTTAENVAILKSLLEENGYKCNAAGRKFVAKRMPVLPKRSFDVDKWKPILQYAEKIGGCKPGETYEYQNAQGGKSIARVCSLYDLPKDMVNPYLAIFSGFMTAPLYAMEALRFFAIQTGILLPSVCFGEEGNKGLFGEEFDREEGIMIKAEYIAYQNILKMMAPKSYVMANSIACKDRTTEGNIYEMYRFAQVKNLKEATFVLCTGNFSYDKRLLAEFMLILKRPEFVDIKINLVLAHCPLEIALTTPEGHISELLLGYVAASLGPLMKDTITFDGQTESEKPERYLMPGVAEADWEVFRELICEYSNMGWPNYQEILYGIDHETAVANIILSDLFARQSFTAGDYDSGLKWDVYGYQDAIGEYRKGSFLKYLMKTPQEQYFR